MLDHQNVILIGYMGTGKTTVGRKIAASLGFAFVDTDERIVKCAGKPIPQIFADDGEEVFRQIESQVIRDAADDTRQVISTGGGIVTRAENREVIHHHGFCVWLQATADTVYKRISGDTNRPLLQTSDPRATISKMLAERESMYAKTAHFEVPTDSLIEADIAYGIAESARVFFREHTG